MYSSAERLADFLRPERARVVQHFAVAIAQNVGGKPAAHAQQARLQTRRDQRLHERLAALIILAAHRQIPVARQFQQRRHVRGQVRRAVGVRHAQFQRRVGVDLAGRDLRIVLLQPAFEILQRGVHRCGLVKDLGGSAPDHGQPRSAGLFLEPADVVHHPLGVVHLRACVFTFGPLMRLTKFWSNTAFIGFSAESGSFNCSRSGMSSTPAFTAAS